jgi:hypothetical protein
VRGFVRVDLIPCRLVPAHATPSVRSPCDREPPRGGLYSSPHSVDAWLLMQPRKRCRHLQVERWMGPPRI